MSTFMQMSKQDEQLFLKISKLQMDSKSLFKTIFLSQLKRDIPKYN